MKKNTEPNNPDIVDLRCALELVAETTLLLNKQMKELEKRQQVRSIEHHFTSAVSLVKPHRKFLREGAMTKVDKTCKDKAYTFFLFNDMMCYASGGSEQLKLHTTLPVDRFFFIQDVPHHDKYSDRSFELHSSVKSFIVHCAENKRKKQEDINAAVREREPVRLQPGKTQESELAASPMVPDDWSDECHMKDCESHLKFSFVNRSDGPRLQ